MSDRRQAQTSEFRVPSAILLILVLVAPVSCSAEPSPEDQRVISALCFRAVASAATSVW